MSPITASTKSTSRSSSGVDVDRTLGHDIGRAAAADDVEQVDARQPGTDEKNDDAADAERHAESAAASAASVLNVASVARCPAHVCLPKGEG